MKIKLLLTYKGPKIPVVNFESEWLEEDVALKVLADLDKTGRLKEVSIVDEMNREWSRKEFGKLREKQKEEPRDPVVYFDGGFNKSTQTAGIGIVIYYRKGAEQYRLRLNMKADELSSNNEAEYLAMYQALVAIEQLEIRHMACTFRGDAQGVLKQAAGEWPCYDPNLNDWLDKIENKISDLGIKPIFEVISRTENKEADKLASQALDGKMIDSHIRIGED